MPRTSPAKTIRSGSGSANRLVVPVWACSLLVTFSSLGCGDDSHQDSVGLDVCRVVPEACDGLDNDCDGEIDEGLGTVGCGLGPCARLVEFCVDAVVQTCVPLERASTEVCDGSDNDCDGEVDEQLDRLVCGVGPCRHTESPCVEGVPQRCDPLLGASGETCDGIDNDCNGAVDDLPQITCGAGPCAVTVDACTAGVPGTCEPKPVAQREICDGIDNDCDGAIDEPFPELGRPCQGGLGVCASPGTFACDASGELVCAAELTLPEVEVCNGEDDDCNGVVDDIEPVVCGQGACLHVLRCRGGQAPLCDPLRGASTEICDGIDNDCDGEIDEAADGSELRIGCYTASPLTMSRGLCHPGYRRCLDGMIAGSCLEQVTPQIEVADGLDNDCDGGIDEGIVPPVSMSSFAGSLAFAMGTSRSDVALLCAHAAAQEARFLMRDVTADLVERCANDVDDDCDGVIDEPDCDLCTGAGCLEPPGDCVVELGDRNAIYLRRVADFSTALCPQLYGDPCADVSECSPFAGLCALDEDCAPGRQCRFGRCAEPPPCTADEDCGRGEDCVDSLCLGGPNPRTVVVPPFYLDSLEVTVADFAACLAEGGCGVAAEVLNAWAADPLCNFATDRDAAVCTANAALPMNCVDSEQADQYCRAVSKRLPNAAEWEVAAAGLGCLVDEQCPPGAACVFGECRLLRTCGQGCDADEICVDELCVRPSRMRRPYPWGLSPPSCSNAAVALTACDDAVAAEPPVELTVCADGEILALQFGAYRCVDARTCRPSGDDGCGDDGDCAPGQLCCHPDSWGCLGPAQDTPLCGCAADPLPSGSCSPACPPDSRMGCGTGRSFAVGSLARDVSPERVHDLGGNVAEWVVKGDPSAGFEPRGASFLSDDPRAMATGASVPLSSAAMGFRCALSGPSGN